MTPLSEEAADKRGFHTLDALRGIAALAVVLFHASFFYGMTPPPEGQIAVDLFFVMSGFIIAYRYDNRFTAGLGVRGFLRIRLIRLYPLFLLGSVVGALPAIAAALGGSGASSHWPLLASLPLAAAMLPSHLAAATTDFVYPLNAPAWSLALEMLINLAYVATFRFWTMPRLIGCVLLGFLALAAADLFYGTLDIGFFWSHYIGGFVRVLFGFAAGVLIFRRFAQKPFRAALPWWSLLLIIAVVFWLPPPVSRAWWELALVAVVVPAVVVCAVSREPPRWAHRACLIAGTYSYVVYSLHFVLIGIFLRMETRLHADQETASLGKAAAFTLLVAAASIAAHLLYDKPVRRWLSRSFTAPRPLAPAWRPR